MKTAIVLFLCFALVDLGWSEGAMAQAATESGTDSSPAVLDDSLESWVNSQYRAAALCRETLYQMINEHHAFTSPKGLENAQKLTDLLSGLIDTARTELFAKGLTFEQSQQIDSYFYAATQPKTAQFVASKDPSLLAIDIRTCPAAAGKLQQWLAEVQS